MGLSTRSRTQTGSRARFLFRFLAFAAAAAVTIFLGGPSANAQATDVYLAHSAVGGANGADCNNAYSYTFFNSSGNWGTGGAQIGPGTTVHLCGTFTGTPGQTLLTFQGSGSSGKPVTVFLEPGAVLSAPYWSASGAIVASGKSWIVIDGGSNGTIQNTADGTGLTYQQPSWGIALNNTSNVTVQHLNIINLCQVTSPSDDIGCDTSVTSTGIALTGGAKNDTIAHNLIHDVNVGILSSTQPGDVGTISYNTIYRVGNSVQQFWAGGPGTAHGFDLIGNEMSCVVGAACNWANTSGGARHLEIMHVWSGAGDVYDGMVIANNYFHDGQGNWTGMLNLDPNGNSNVVINFKIFNNIFKGVVNYSTSAGNGSGFLFANNTFIGTSGNVGIANLNSPYNVVNNIFSTIGVFFSTQSQTLGSTFNFNDYFNGGSMAFQGTTDVGTLSEWHGASTNICSGGCDANSINSNPNLTTAFVPSGGSPVIGKGANLTSLGIALLNQGAPQSFGVNYACGIGCVPRPATGAWDIGAYQSGTGIGSVAPPTPPTGLTALIQ
jgi:hypothetical protein